MQTRRTSRGRSRVVRGAARFLAMVMMMVALWGAAGSVYAQQPPPKVPDGFVPVDSLPEQEQLPAAPLVMGAYAIAWVLFLGYVWSLWTRLGRVEREMGEISRRVTSGTRR